MKTFGSLLLLIAILLSSCTAATDATLSFDAQLSVGGSSTFTVTAEVYNSGERTFRAGEDFAAQLHIYDEEGDLNVCVEAAQFAGPLEPADSHFPAGWKGTLPAGAYRLTWGAENYGAIEKQFRIVERDGKLYLDEASLLTEQLNDVPWVDNCAEFSGPTPPERDFPSPPPARMVIGDESQISGIGSYCWSEPDSEVGICEDTIGIPTPRDPLLAASPVEAVFSFTVDQPPIELSLILIPSTDTEELQFTTGDMRWWGFQGGERYNLELQNPSAIDLALEPGTYILALFARWDEYGDVTYGFLIEVQ
jgi:hypothetical protein